MNGTVTISLSDFKKLESEALAAERFRTVIKNTIEVIDEETGEVDAWDFTKIEMLAKELHNEE